MYTLGKELRLEEEGITYLHMNIFENGDKEVYITLGDTGPKRDEIILKSELFGWNYGYVLVYDKNNHMSGLWHPFSCPVTTEMALKLMQEVRIEYNLRNK